MNCCALATAPNHPSIIYAGLRNGIYRSDDHGLHFYRLESPVNAYEVWSVAIHPADPDIVFAGCRPGAIFRTRDGGERWEKRLAEFTSEGVFGGPARVLRMVFAPLDHDIVWAGVEADGVRLSTDGGENLPALIWKCSPPKMLAKAGGQLVCRNGFGLPIAGMWRSRLTTRTRYISPWVATTTAWPAWCSARLTVAKPGTHWSFPPRPTR